MKAQRRTWQRPRQPRPPSHQPRIRILQGLNVQGRLGVQGRCRLDSSNAEEAAAGEAEATSEMTRDIGKHNHSARSRLRARFVARRTSELVETLERRHGGAWMTPVVKGGFEWMALLRRLCEAYHLRPEMEQAVLKATIEYARARRLGVEDKQSLDDATLPHIVPNPSMCCDISSSSCNQSGPLCDSFTCAVCAETNSGSESACCSHATLSASSCEVSEASDESSSSDEKEDDQKIVRRKVTPSRTAKVSMPPWKVRAFRSLGLDQSTSSLDLDASFENDDVVSARLVEALDNAQQQASRRSSLDGVCDSDAETVSSSLELGTRKSKVDASLCSHVIGSACKRRSPWFAARSEIVFFDCLFAEELQSFVPVADLYSSDLYTKGFDGPSGHKARRYRTAECMVERDVLGDRLQQGDGGYENDSDASEDPDDEWEKQCNTIAELMSSQRSTMMWSSTW